MKPPEAQADDLRRLIEYIKKPSETPVLAYFCGEPCPRVYVCTDRERLRRWVRGECKLFT